MIAYVLVFVLLIILFLSVGILFSILSSDELSEEDKSFRLKKGMFESFLLVLKNAKRFVEFSQYGKPRVDPKKVMLGSLLEDLQVKLDNFNPAHKIKKEIEVEIFDFIRAKMEDFQYRTQLNITAIDVSIQKTKPTKLFNVECRVGTPS